MTPRSALAVAPAAVFVVASVSADLVAVIGHDPIGIWRVLPAGPVSGSWVNAEVSSTALLLVAISLARAKRVGWYLALAVLAAAAVVQGVLDHHTIAAAVAGLVAGVLIATRRRYVVRTGIQELALAAGLLAFGGALVLVDGATGHGPFLRHMGWLLGTWLDAGAIGRLSLAAGLGLLLVVARVAFIGALIISLGPAPDPRSDSTRWAARRDLARLGRGPLLPYQSGPLAEPFANPAGDGVLAYARAGRTAVSLGDPSGPGALVAFDAWLDQCRLLDWQPAVYQASATFRSTLVARGWHAVRVGSEAILNPVTFDLSTPRLANVRHTVSRARRGGLRTTSSHDGTAPPGVPMSGLLELDAAWRHASGPSLGFTVGHFDPERLADSLVVAALGAGDRLEAFVVLRPTGADQGWMLDLMRRRRAGIPGAVELCLVRAIETLGSAGVERLSLGLAPLAGLAIDAGPVEERMLAIAAQLARPVYDVKGLAFYKDKFAPAWEPRHLVVPSRMRLLGAAQALVWLHLGGSWRTVLRSLSQPVARLTRTPPRLAVVPPRRPTAP